MIDAPPPIDDDDEDDDDQPDLGDAETAEAMTPADSIVPPVSTP